jgi:hypothetical protein
MNERRTTSMLQRVPLILAVTAASYGLPLQPQTSSRRAVTGDKQRPSPRAGAAARATQHRHLSAQH